MEIEIATPKCGDMLENGATVIRYDHQHDGGNGKVPYGRVMARMHDDYVIWHTCALQERTDRLPDRYWLTTGGEYFGDNFDRCAAAWLAGS